MDEWSTEYLRSWADDFKDEPDAKKSLQFLEDVISQLKRLPSSNSSTTASESPGAVAVSIIKCVESQRNPEMALEDVQSLIFEAVISSSLSSNDLAEVIQSLLEDLTGSLSKKLEHQLASNTRERWNGPERSSPKKGIDECVKEWVSLNSFVAHLTRAHTMPLEDYALRTFNRAFGPDIDLDEKPYHISAAAAWLDIMGQEIYKWSLQSSGEDPPSAFELQKWHEWKKGFEDCSNSDRVDPQTKHRAEIALCKMNTLETTT